MTFGFRSEHMQFTKFQFKVISAIPSSGLSGLSTSLHHAPPRLAGVARENKNLKTKEPKGQRINPIPQAAPIHPEHNERNTRVVDCRRSGKLLRFHCPEAGTMRKYQLERTTRNTRSLLHCRSLQCPGRRPPKQKNRSCLCHPTKDRLRARTSSASLGRCRASPCCLLGTRSFQVPSQAS